jgi:hypothetical protein
VVRLKERDHLEELGVEGRSLKWVLREVGWGDDWIQQALDWDQWRAVLNTVMDIFFS